MKIPTTRHAILKVLSNVVSLEAKSIQQQNMGIKRSSIYSVLTRMVDDNLVVRLDNGFNYAITEKGIAVLQSYEWLKVAQNINTIKEPNINTLLRPHFQISS